VTLIAERPLGAPRAEAVMARAATENFTVASWLLPRRQRDHLLAIYGFARLVDELGDSLAGDRGAALDWLAAELDLAYEGHATHPLLVRLQPVLVQCALPRDPFLRLIEANRVDQRTHRYRTWEQLRAYCALSADPVGELVLEVFGLATPARVALSDSICTALQLAEHCQDVAEDLAAGRVYLPLEDLERFGVRVEDLHSAHVNAPLRELLAFEVARARALLHEGIPLVAELRGRLPACLPVPGRVRPSGCAREGVPFRVRLAVAGYVGGGEAALRAIEAAGYDVLAGAPSASTALRLRCLAGTLRAASGRR